jgi:hypothetical protein
MKLDTVKINLMKYQRSIASKIWVKVKWILFLYSKNGESVFAISATSCTRRCTGHTDIWAMSVVEIR